MPLSLKEKQEEEATYAFFAVIFALGLPITTWAAISEVPWGPAWIPLFGLWGLFGLQIWGGFPVFLEIYRVVRRKSQ